MTLLLPFPVQQFYMLKIIPLLNSNNNLELLVTQEDQALKAALEWFEANCLFVILSKTANILFPFNL